MATYSKEDFDAKHYHDARPQYPDSFYETLLDYHTQKDGNATNFAMDVGCGSGFVGLKLTDYFDQVLGTDLSATMIQISGENARSGKKESIEFISAPAEHAPSVVKASSVDMITAAEACHWMNMDQFFVESARILKPNGTLAYWFYLDPVFIGYPEATKLNLHFSYDSSVQTYGDDYERFLGPFFENPGHNRYRSGLQGVNPPENLYYEVIRHFYHPEQHGSEHTSLYIKKNITLRTYKEYSISWSGYHSWKAANPTKPDTVDWFISELQRILAVDLDTPINVVFPTVYTLARKR